MEVYEGGSGTPIDGFGDRPSGALTGLRRIRSSDAALDRRWDPRDVDPTRSLAVAIETFFDVYRNVVGNLRLPDGNVGRPYDNYYALRQIATAAGSVRVEHEAGLDLEMTPVRFDFATGLNTASVATALTCPSDAASRSCASHRSVRGRHWA